jgi:ubiquinone/menaquinone biosynthesis C-methylase UbiE
MNKKEFNDFFEPYAKNVDNANKHGFWKLSDELIMQIIKNNIPDTVDEDKAILDAGGGTGRWVCDLSKVFKSKFIVYDLSSDMLSQAKRNIKSAGVENRVRLVEGDLKDMKEIESDSVDFIISIYSPISFIYEKEKAYSEIFRVLKKGGKIMIMGHGFYNALASKINNYCASEEELSSLDNDQMVKWGDGIPKLNVFSQEIFEIDLKQAGFVMDKVYGVPVFVQPGAEDFDSKNIEKSRISEALEKEEFFKKVFETEMKYNSLPTVNNRGVNMFAIARKEI